jgi:hypothetical protein
MHDKSPELVASTIDLSSAVVLREPETPPLSQHNFQLFTQMQMVRVLSCPRCSWMKL